MTLIWLLKKKVPLDLGVYGSLFSFISQNTEFGLFGAFCAACRPYLSPKPMMLFVLRFITDHSFNIIFILLPWKGEYLVTWRGILYNEV